MFLGSHVGITNVVIVDVIVVAVVVWFVFVSHQSTAAAALTGLLLIVPIYPEIYFSLKVLLSSD